MVVVERVEAGHAQQVRQAAQVGVGHEARRAQRPGAHAQQRRDVERLELGIYGHAVAVCHHALERRRFAVDEDYLHLGMWHAQRLDHVLDRGRARARARQVPAARRWRQKVVQFLVETEGGGDHGGEYATIGEVERYGPALVCGGLPAATSRCPGAARPPRPCAPTASWRPGLPGTPAAGSGSDASSPRAAPTGSGTACCLLPRTVGA